MEQKFFRVFEGDEPQGPVDAPQACRQPAPIIPSLSKVELDFLVRRAPCVLYNSLHCGLNCDMCGRIASMHTVDPNGRVVDSMCSPTLYVRDTKAQHLTIHPMYSCSLQGLKLFKSSLFEYWVECKKPCSLFLYNESKQVQLVMHVDGLGRRLDTTFECDLSELRATPLALEATPPFWLWRTKNVKAKIAQIIEWFPLAHDTCMVLGMAFLSLKLARDVLSVFAILGSPIHEQVQKIIEDVCKTLFNMKSTEVTGVTTFLKPQYDAMVKVLQSPDLLQEHAGNAKIRAGIILNFSCACCHFDKSIINMALITNLDMLQMSLRKGSGYEYYYCIESEVPRLDAFCAQRVKELARDPNTTIKTCGFYICDPLGVVSRLMVFKHGSFNDMEISHAAIDAKCIPGFTKIAHKLSRVHTPGT